jgi:hypothetical protein
MHIATLKTLMIARLITLLTLPRHEEIRAAEIPQCRSEGRRAKILLRMVQAMSTE